MFPVQHLLADDDQLNIHPYLHCKTAALQHMVSNKILRSGGHYRSFSLGQPQHTVSPLSSGGRTEDWILCTGGVTQAVLCDRL